MIRDAVAGARRMAAPVTSAPLTTVAAFMLTEQSHLSPAEAAELAGLIIDNTDMTDASESEWRKTHSRIC